MEGTQDNQRMQEKTEIWNPLHTKSTLKCIKVYIHKTFSKCQGYLISRFKYLANKKSPWGHDGQGFDV